jgi:hypothetical protein
MFKQMLFLTAGAVIALPTSPKQQSNDFSRFNQFDKQPDKNTDQSTTYSLFDYVSFIPRVLSNDGLHSTDPLMANPREILEQEFKPLDFDRWSATDKKREMNSKILSASDKKQKVALLEDVLKYDEPTNIKSKGKTQPPLINRWSDSNYEQENKFDPFLTRYIEDLETIREETESGYSSMDTIYENEGILEDSSAADLKNSKPRRPIRSFD